MWNSNLLGSVKDRSALKMAVLYALLGAFWILFSDKLLISYLPDLQRITIFQTVKGLVFILVTALLAYSLCQRYIKRHLSLERDLEESRGKLIFAIRSGKIGFWQWNKESGKMSLNQFSAEMLGYPSEGIEIDLQFWEKGIHPDDLPKRSALLKAFLDNPQSTYEAEYRVQTKSGEWKWILSRASTVELDQKGRVSRMFGTHTDVTQLKEAEQRLAYRFALEKLVSLISSRFINIGPEKIDAEIINALKETAEFARVDRSYVFLFSEDRTRMDNTHEWCTEGIEPQIDHLKDLPVDRFPWWMERLGRLETINIQAVPELPAEAAPEKEILERQDIKSLLVLPLIYENSLQGFMGFDSVKVEKKWEEEDIALLQLVGGIVVNALQRKKVEERRRLLESTIEQAAEVVLITDTDGKIQYVNPVFENITGFSKDEAIGSTPRLLKSGQHGKEFYRDLWDSLNSGKSWKGRLINKKKDGTLYNEDTICFPVRDSAGRIANFVSVKRDITREIELEKQLLHAQKMESIGLLASGVAHDFNNMLTTIMGYSSLINSKKELPEKIRNMLAEIERASHRGAELTSQLLTFSRKQPPKLEVINLNDIVSHAVRFLGRVLGSAIQIELDLEKNLGLIEADSSQLHQVLMNLSINARDAMPKGGKIFVKTSNIDIEQKYILAHSYAKMGPHVCLSFTDTGIGMDKDTMTRIFEPFFTTKESGKGTGLGLSIVYGIIKNHRGIINAYSEPGQGTTFKIFFPWTESKEKKQPEQQFLVLGGNETILVVDDDEAVLHLACGILEEYGYKTLTAENGAKALEIYGKKYNDIQLVLVDVVMPKMSGLELFKEIRKLNPEAKVILSSGFTLSDEKDLLEQGVKAFIPKPYQESFLARTVRNVLDEGRNKANRGDEETQRPIQIRH